MESAPRDHRPALGLALLKRAAGVLVAALVIGSVTLLPQILTDSDMARAAEPEAVSDKVPATVREVIVNGKRQPACAATAAGGHAPNLACLNLELEAAARPGDPPAPAIDAAARDAQTPSKTGAFSQAATAERLGKNFGHSAQPYRPPPPAYSNPIMTGKPR